jgi:hypothetical protein
MLDNIDPDNVNNFEKTSDVSYTTYDSVYPHMSVMHYRSNGLAIDASKPTIVTKDPFYQNLIGQRTSLTKADIDLLNNLYSYKSGCTCSKIEFSGLEQTHLNGVYVKDANGSLVGDKFAYAHETSANWLFYMPSFSAWLISTHLNGNTINVRAFDSAACPENVQNKWEERATEENDNVVARCVDNVS